jgi:tRNA threonylcarbamoyladenosine biosynthesis protein TsaE
LAQGLSIKERILSPTFIVSRNYPLKSGGRFYHFDWYRLENDNQVRALGITDLFDKNNIIAIEWADRARGLLPKKRIEVYFKQGKKDNQREITVIEK